MEHLKNISYYQFYKELDYPIFLKFEDAKLELMLRSVIESLGFNKVENESLSSIKIDKATTRVLVVKEATYRVAKQIVRPHKGLESIGQEDISPYGNYDVYRYINAAIMMMGHNEYFWEMAVCNIEDKKNEIKVAITRYLGLALSSLEVLGFWGNAVEGGYLVTKANSSNFKSFFVDCNKGVFIGPDGIRPINKQSEIIRVDETLRGREYSMSKEALLGFLCHNSIYFSYMGLDFKLKKAIFDLVDHVNGKVVPQEFVEKRSSLQLP